MKKLSTYLAEEKNVHMEHLEDSIFNFGVRGAREAINFLQSLRDMLSGSSTTAVDTTVKWDGAPAIFAGTDPRDGKFFVAKKGVFNKEPKIYKTSEEIDGDFGSNDLGTKFKLALRELPKLGITGVIQGDFLYSNDTLGTETIEGEKLVTFHPNTIVYAVPYSSELGKKIRSSKIGIVWHTRYVGDSFESMKAEFGKDISSKLSQVKTVWHTDATYKDVSGSATMTKSETDTITSLLSSAGKTFRKVNSKTLNQIADNEEIKTRIKTHFNSKVREGQKVTNPRAHVRDLVSYVIKWYDKQIESKKTEKGKAPWIAKKKEMMRFFGGSNVKDLIQIFTLMNQIIDAKELIIKKMDKASSIGTFLKTKSGYKVTSPEGYVAINNDGESVKLVNRMEFSKANFSDEVIKGWQK
ncbi:MAG: DUF6267 family protein [Candidatus Poseidoniales archaeon]